MDANDLTRQDVDVLIEAMEAWERSGSEGQLMGSLMGSLLCRGDEEAMAKMKKEQERSRREFEEKQRLRKERSVVLRAKLISLRDAANATAFLGSL